MFRSNSEELQKYQQDGELAKHVIRPLSGPGQKTIKAPDTEIIDEYLTAKPGFVTKIVESRLWVFKAGSEELTKFEEDGELAKHVIRPLAGPNNMTIKAPDTETIDEYLCAMNH